MRLWHYKLIPVLPNQMLVSQWRECVAIKRQWEKETLKHRLVSYVLNYDRMYFGTYFTIVLEEMKKRNFKVNHLLQKEMIDFCYNNRPAIEYIEYIGKNYPQHNKRYLKQCYYNLEEKYDRGIITEDEFQKILNADIYELGDIKNEF